MKKSILLAMATLFSSQVIGNCEELKDGSTRQVACLQAQSAENIEENVRVLINKIGAKFDEWPQPAYSKLILHLSQETWLQHRNKQCEFEQHLRGGIEGVNFSKCRNRMNKAREAELKTLLGE